MSKAWRLIVDAHDVFWNMAMDEAMLLLRNRGVIPSTVRLYVIKPSAVTIGYFQKIKEAVDLEYITTNNIPVARRITGGGSVYHDEAGEVTYCVVADTSEFPGDVEDSYRRICGVLVRAIGKFGVKAEFKPVNDIIINGRKISGSAQARKGRALMQHGTLMYNTDIEVLANVLKAPKEKLKAHGVKSILERVTTLSKELGRKVERDEVIKALIESFEEELDIRLVKGSYVEEEVKLAGRLLEKYRSREWLYRR